jgi:hypothetical protein
LAHDILGNNAASNEAVRKGTRNGVHVGSQGKEVHQKIRKSSALGNREKKHEEEESQRKKEG